MTANQNDSKERKEKEEPGERKEERKRQQKNRKTQTSALRNPDGCQTTLVMAHAKEKEEENIGNEIRETGYRIRDTE